MNLQHLKVEILRFFEWLATWNLDENTYANTPLPILAKTLREPERRDRDAYRQR